jgi:membrane-associated phospholipid phosphatase
MSARVSIRARLLIAAFASAVGLVALYLLAVRTTVGQRVDELAVFENRYVRTTDADAERYLSIAAGVFVTVGIAVCWMARTRIRLLAVSLIGVVSSYVFAAALREFGFRRTDLVGHDSLNGASFPSGHTATAVALALAILIVSPRRGVTALLAALCLAGSIGTLVVLIPIHRPSDVIGGDLVAFATMCVTLVAVPGATGLASPSGRASSRAQPGESRTLVGTLAGGTVLLTGAWIVATHLLTARAGFTLMDFGSFYPIAVTLVIAAAAVVIGVFRTIAARPIGEAEEGSRTIAGRVIAVEPGGVV